MALAWLLFFSFHVMCRCCMTPVRGVFLRGYRCSSAVLCVRGDGRSDFPRALAATLFFFFLFFSPRRYVSFLYLIHHFPSPRTRSALGVSFGLLRSTVGLTGELADIEQPMLAYYALFGMLALWPHIFFRGRHFFMAFLWIIGTTALAGVATLLVMARSFPAGVLMVPLDLWLVYASTINFWASFSSRAKVDKAVAKVCVLFVFAVFILVFPRFI